MTEMRDIVERLGDACIGHPNARIPWPHRILHEARVEITALRQESHERLRLYEQCEEIRFALHAERFDWQQRAEAAEKRVAKLEAALRRCAEATPGNTNSPTANSMASWVHAVAKTALEDAASARAKKENT